mmetsp:Transcript_141723/g.395140  ORF Transcript_141723/g.395140 Transcript_141723/m.395140 type:complete len:113 (-) Transcript_141723:91-429(-)
MACSLAVPATLAILLALSALAGGGGRRGGGAALQPVEGPGPAFVADAAQDKACQKQQSGPVLLQYATQRHRASLLPDSSPSQPCGPARPGFLSILHERHQLSGWGQAAQDER